MSETKEFKVGDCVWIANWPLGSRILDDRIAGQHDENPDMFCLVNDDFHWFPTRDLFHTDLEAHQENVRRHQQALNQATLAMARAFPDNPTIGYAGFESNGCGFFVKREPYGWESVGCPGEHWDTPAEAIEAVIGESE